MRLTMRARGLALITIVVLVCSVVHPGVVAATDEPFPAAFADAGQWQPIAIGSLPGTPERFGSLAGIRASRPGRGVTITVLDGAS